MLVDASQVYVDGTVGVARYPGDAADAPDLLKKADIGLYSAKQADRGSLRVYSPEIAAVFEQHSEAVDLVRNALARDALVPFYQPKVHLHNGRCWGFEALARVIGDDGSVLSASSFAPALQDRIMARRIGKRMLTAVVNDITAWRDSGFGPISVSLNVSEFDFVDEKFVDRILQSLDEKALPRACLSIEVLNRFSWARGRRSPRKHSPGSTTQVSA